MTRNIVMTNREFVILFLQYFYCYNSLNYTEARAQLNKVKNCNMPASI